VTVQGIIVPSSSAPSSSRRLLEYLTLQDAGTTIP